MAIVTIIHFRFGRRFAKSSSIYGGGGVTVVPSAGMKGDCLDVKLADGGWVPSRIEFAHGAGGGWYLVGINTRNLIGLLVRQ